MVLAAAITGGIALATNNSSEPLPGPQPAAVPAVLAQHFAVLSDGTSKAVAGIGSADSATVTRLDASTEGIAAQFGTNPSLAKQVTYQSKSIWVIPGSTGICIHDFETGSGVCGPTAHALSGDITLDVGGNENGVTGGGTIYGLAPDGNSSILVHDADGSTESVPVEHNVYVIGRPGAVSIDVVNSDGQTQSITLPR